MLQYLGHCTFLFVQVYLKVEAFRIRPISKPLADYMVKERTSTTSIIRNLNSSVENVFGSDLRSCQFIILLLHKFNKIVWMYTICFTKNTRFVMQTIIFLQINNSHRLI